MHHANDRTTRQGRLPDFIVMGSMKCGTTSLHHYLSCHPDVYVSRPKELNFFLGGGRQEDNDPPWGNWWRGEAWYRSHFVTDRRVCGEVSPGYVRASSAALTMARMWDLRPDARLVLVVREPMERLRSHYLMVRRDAHETMPTFEEFVSDSRFADEVACSDYGSQIGRILERFPHESLLVVESAELDRNRSATLGRLFRFLGVEPGFRSPCFSRRLFERKHRRFPTGFGRRVLRSPLMRLSERLLPFTLHEAVRNMLLTPFSVPEPTPVLPAGVEAALRARFRDEVDRARRLSRLPLPSLGD